MDERDQELLDKQLWGVSPTPRPSGGVLILAFIAVFLGGLVVGSVLFAQNGKQTQMTSYDIPTAFTFLNNSPPNLR
jgi:hypothetical protein